MKHIVNVRRTGLALLALSLFSTALIAEGLRDGMKEVRIFGVPHEVKARVECLDELSGHADSEELLAWMKPITPRLKKVFLVHGEPERSEALRAQISERYGIETLVARPGDIYEL